MRIFAFTTFHDLSQNKDSSFRPKMRKALLRIPRKMLLRCARK